MFLIPINFFFYVKLIENTTSVNGGCYTVLKLEVIYPLYIQLVQAILKAVANYRWKILSAIGNIMAIKLGEGYFSKKTYSLEYKMLNMNDSL